MDMFNDLRRFLDIRDVYQFWFYLYPTGQPFWITAAQLRRSLADMHQDLDPGGHNEKLNQMVLVGHSMGGLVVAATAVAHHAPDEQAEDQREDDRGRDPGAEPQIPDVIGSIASGHRERQALDVGVVDRRAAAQHDRCEGENRQLQSTHGAPFWFKIVT